MTVLTDALAELQYPPRIYAGKPRIFPLGSQVFAPGGADLRYKTEKNGYLDGFIVRAWGTHTVAVANLVRLPRSPWNVIREFRLNPPGRQKFLRVGGHAAHIHDVGMHSLHPSSFGARAGEVPSPIDANTGRSALAESFQVVVGVGQTMEMWWYISSRRSWLDSRGRIPLHNDSDTILYASPQTAAELFTVGANLTVTAWNLDVWQVTYDEVPDSPQIKRHNTQYVLTYEEQEDILQVGDNKVNIDPGGLILAVATTLRLNETDVTSGLPDYVNFKVDNIDITEPIIDPRPWFFLQKRSNDFLFQDGTFYWDFDRDVDTDGALSAALPDGIVGATKLQPSLGRVLDTTDVKQIKINYHLPAGTVLGATPRAYTTVRRLLRVA